MAGVQGRDTFFNLREKITSLGKKRDWDEEWVWCEIWEER